MRKPAPGEKEGLAKIAARARERGGSREPLVRLNRSRQHGRDPRRKHGVDGPMEFEIFHLSHPAVCAGTRRADDDLVMVLKEMVMSTGLTRKRLYDFIGILFLNENAVYNLEYGLRTRPSISLENASRWARVMGCELTFSIQPIQGDDSLATM